MVPQLSAVFCVELAIIAGGSAPMTYAPAGKRKHAYNILFVSDFFYPNIGGVESHMYQLSQLIIARGHKVVILTHAYGTCRGVRYLTNGLKVYYVHRLPAYSGSTFPTAFGGIPYLRQVLLREQIDLIHSHQAGAVMGLEALMNGISMGFKVVFTDHSLFGFADTNSIMANKTVKHFLANVHHVICVSHTSKENLVLRACLAPSRVSVIPNAIDGSQFTPAPPGEKRWRPEEGITIVILSRLVYRKGMDMLAVLIPEVCARHPKVRFIIGGDGPKRKLLEQVIVREGLGERVQLQGAIPHENAREFLLQGQIFLNSSLTEAFCIAVVEAACAGLLVVSTAVGGVPEVLPADMLILAEPSPQHLLGAIEEALIRVEHSKPWEQHHRVRDMYNWGVIADRTLAVYDKVLSSSKPDRLYKQLASYSACGAFSGQIWILIVMLSHWVWRLIEWLQPTTHYDRCPTWRNASCKPNSLHAAEVEVSDANGLPSSTREIERLTSTSHFCQWDPRTRYGTMEV